MSNESYPHSNPYPPAHDADSGCASEPTSPSAPTGEAPSSDVAVKLGVLPSIDVKADVNTGVLKTELDASASAEGSPTTDDPSSGGLDIDVSVATPDVVGLLGSGDSEGGYPLVSLDSETDAVVNVPLFGESGVLDGAHDVGSLLTAAMLDVGGGGCLGAIIGGDAYDGNVPLATDLSSALGSTLDLLTTTSSLFDVPALDILGCDGLDS